MERFSLLSLILYLGNLGQCNNEYRMKISSINKPDYCRFKADYGDHLKINFIIRENDQNGPIITARFSKDKMMTFELGDGMHWDGFHQALDAMCQGETRTAQVKTGDIKPDDFKTKLILDRIPDAMKIKNLHFTITLVEISKGPDIASIVPGLRFGHGPPRVKGEL